MPVDHERVVATVVKIIDGDTIVVNIDGKEFKLRYIGVDSPEAGNFGGTQATHYNEQLVMNKTVILVKDVSETDSLGRLLRYVVVDSKFVNYELVSSGYARSGSWPPDTSCDSTFATAYTAAKTGKLGIWGLITPTVIYPTPRSARTSAPATSVPSGGCNCSIDYDCANFSTHAQAQACYVQCGGNNWSGLDRDRDGLACESLP